jgi:hypothetical protein
MDVNDEIRKWNERAARSRRRWASVGTWISVGLALLLVACGILIDGNGCRIEDDEATRVITGYGYTRVELGSVGLFACASGESSREFRAWGPGVGGNIDGRMVEGVVCCGLIAKACTLRFR